MRRIALALAGAAALAGCPIPQPLPDYPAGTVTPPRIVVEGIANPGTVVLVPASCPPGHEPSTLLTATLIDVDTFERVVARWFVNYDPIDPGLRAIRQEDDIPGVDATPPQTERAVPLFTFFPYGSWGNTIASSGGGSGRNEGAVQIVELVVSNGFDPAAVGPPVLLPNRTPLIGFETQVYRWVFMTVPQSATTVCPP